MPVTTETFRNQNVLHRVFAVASMLLVLSVIIAVIQDWNREFRRPQTQARIWNGAMAEFETEIAQYKAEQADLEAKESQLAEMIASVEMSEEYRELKARIEELTVARNMLAKNLSLHVTGNIAPVQQQIQNLEALLDINEGTDEERQQLQTLRDELQGYLSQKIEGENQIAAWDAEISELKGRQRELRAVFADLEAQVTQMKTDLAKKVETFKSFEPDLAGRIGNFIRNQPLLDWMNPSIRVKQQQVTGVLTDLNVMTTFTLDRCMSCHTNIDDPKFTEEAVIDFLESQVASDEGEAVLALGDISPVTALDYWENSILAIPDSSESASRRLRLARRQAMESYNRLLRRADPEHGFASAWKSQEAPESEEIPVLEDDADLQSFFVLVRTSSQRPLDWQEWYRPLTVYRTTLHEIVRETLDETDYRAFMDGYRRELIARYNANADETGRRKLAAGRELLAHPRLDLYAHPDSRHPIATMGCTSCHSGSGEETQFVHTAHTPSAIWVDEETGALVADFQVAMTGSKSDVSRALLNGSGEASAAAPGAATVLQASFDEAATEQEPAHGEAHGDETAHDHDHDHGPTVMDGRYYSDASELENPFGPIGAYDHAEAAIYVDPVSGERRRAVHQKDYWKKRYGWKQIEFHYWERPMHELRYVESSCIRCHTEVADIDQEATTLAKGRALFTEVGCITCHPVEGLGSPIRGQQTIPDVRQVGPSLENVRHKLSEEMMASWIWAPKALRPNTRMPHYFMLENNSTPLDIRRTRAEVAAMAHFLASEPQDAGWTPSGDAYEPAPIPEEVSGSASRGRELFASLGCLACHANVNEHGQEMVALDLQERFGLDRDGALARMAEDARSLAEFPDASEADEENVGFFELDDSGRPTTRIRPDQFNRLQWYLMAHQSEEYTRVGPDLSTVGTKLLTGQSEEKARRWLYNWLLAPEHYSSYTVMPSFRLTEQESADLTEYLLTQKHPQYEIAPFEVDPLMVDAILISLDRNAISEAAATARVEAMSLEERRLELGKRMIQHYGCYGCHQIGGFDSSLTVSADLTTWGRKDPHKLDFGYFDHAYDDRRPPDADVWTTHRSGLDVTAPMVTEKKVGEGGIEKKTVPWEHLHIDRRGYLESKLHNTRIFDRNRASLEGEMADDGRAILTDKGGRGLRLVEEDGRFIDLATGEDSGLSADEVRIAYLGDPYLKLRMPNFFLQDEEVHALVTYVTGLQPPLVRADLQDTTDEFGQMRAMGKYMAKAFNCYGCHNIERNTPLIQQYFTIRNDDGSMDYSATQENLTNAPPRIVGNGAKTQHDWFYTFLSNVEMLRPWLEIRMPSYNLEPAHNQFLVEYIVGQTRTDSRHLEEALAPVNSRVRQAFETTYAKTYADAVASGQGGMAADTLAKSAASLEAGRIILEPANRTTRRHLAELASKYQLYSPNQLPSIEMPEEELARKYGQIWYDFAFLRDAYEQVHYPFQDGARPELTPELHARGLGLVETLGCFKCHAFGDEEKLQRIFDLKQEEMAAMMGDMGGDDEEGYEGYGDDEGYGDEGGYGEEDGYGEDDGYGDDEGYGQDEGYGEEPTEAPAPTMYDAITAPNLAIAHERLHASFFKNWLHKPPTLMPGTKMPNLFGPDGNQSAFAAFPEPQKSEFEALYGKTADEQIDLIIRWMEAAGAAGYTYEEEKYLAGESATAVDRQAILDQLAAEAEAQAGEEPAESGEDGGDVIEEVPSDEPAEETAEEPAETPAPVEEASTEMSEEEKASARDEAVSSAMEGVAAGVGRIVGVVVAENPPRPRRLRNNNADCIASRTRIGTPLFEPAITVNRNGTLADVVVAVSNVPQGESSAPSTPLVIDQIGCEYIPHVSASMTGQRIEIRNSDPFAHNVNTAPANNASFNVSQPMQGMVHNVVMEKPEDAIRLKCDVHTFMNAFLFVFEHPFFDVTRIDGVYVIDNLPPGEYTLEVWHERGGTQTVTVTVEAGKAVRQDLTVAF